MPALNIGIVTEVFIAWEHQREEARREAQEKARRLTEIEARRVSATRALEEKRTRYTGAGYVAELHEINEAYRVEKAKYET